MHPVSSPVANFLSTINVDIRLIGTNRVLFPGLGSLEEVCLQASVESLLSHPKMLLWTFPVRITDHLSVGGRN